MTVTFDHGLLTNDTGAELHLFSQGKLVCSLGQGGGATISLSFDSVQLGTPPDGISFVQADGRDYTYGQTFFSRMERQDDTTLALSHRSPGAQPAPAVGFPVLYKRS